MRSPSLTSFTPKIAFTLADCGVDFKCLQVRAALQAVVVALIGRLSGYGGYFPPDSIEKDESGPR